MNIEKLLKAPLPDTATLTAVGRAALEAVVVDRPHLFLEGFLTDEADLDRFISELHFYTGNDETINRAVNEALEVAEDKAETRNYRKIITRLLLDKPISAELQKSLKSS